MAAISIINSHHSSLPTIQEEPASHNIAITIIQDSGETWLKKLGFHTLAESSIWCAFYDGNLKVEQIMEQRDFLRKEAPKGVSVAPDAWALPDLLKFGNKSVWMILATKN